MGKGQPFWTPTCRAPVGGRSSGTYPCQQVRVGRSEVRHAPYTPREHTPEEREPKPRFSEEARPSPRSTWRRG